MSDTAIQNTKSTPEPSEHERNLGSTVQAPKAAAREGQVARKIEEQTVQIPSDWFLWAAGASIAGSLFLRCSDRHHDALFVGQWAPTFLILGLYNKLVKVAGSDGPDSR